MEDVLLIFGLVVTGIGVLGLVYVTFWPPTPEPVAQELDPGQIVEEIRKILEGVERRFRVPLILVFVGLTFAILGVYLKAREAADSPEALVGMLGFLA
jgi:hypothetical protein